MLKCKRGQGIRKQCVESDFIMSIFESGSRVIIAVRVASARSALATLASVKRGWLTEYEVGSGVWRS